MTYKEAINILSNYKMSCGGCKYSHELGCELNKNCCEAVDMAVSALELCDKMSNLPDEITCPLPPLRFTDEEQFSREFLRE